MTVTSVALPNKVGNQVTGRIDTTQTMNSPITQTASTTAPTWSPVGYLRKTALKYGGQPLYRLDDPQGNLLLFATTTPNLTLEPRVNLQMRMFGTTAYINDFSIRNNVMTVSKVELR
jgi:hypothetical protein